MGGSEKERKSKQLKCLEAKALQDPTGCQVSSLMNHLDIMTPVTYNVCSEESVDEYDADIGICINC